MMKEVVSWIKTLASAVVLIAVLKYTGLLSYVTQATQLVAIETGLLDADTSLDGKEVFDYNFTLKNLKGEIVSFEQFKGKVVFLNLWATWCGPCKAEMPGIQKLYESIGSDTIAFVMLSIDRERDQPKVEKYIQDKAFTFPVFLKAGDLTDQLNVPSIPTTFVIGKDGKIASKEIGTTNYNTPKFKKFLNGLVL
jgi:thiol-disulfide isomerase/thioredoxin